MKIALDKSQTEIHTVSARAASRFKISTEGLSIDILMQSPIQVLTEADVA